MRTADRLERGLRVLGTFAVLTPLVAAPPRPLPKDTAYINQPDINHPLGPSLSTSSEDPVSKEGQEEAREQFLAGVEWLEKSKDPNLSYAGKQLKILYLNNQVVFHRANPNSKLAQRLRDSSEELIITRGSISKDNDIKLVLYFGQRFLDQKGTLPELVATYLFSAQSQYKALIELRGEAVKLRLPLRQLLRENPELYPAIPAYAWLITVTQMVILNEENLALRPGIGMDDYVFRVTANYARCQKSEAPAKCWLDSYKQPLRTPGQQG